MNAKGTTYWFVTAATFIGALIMLVTYTPVEQTMGAAQKIFYIHMPVAICTLACALVVFVGSIGYLLQRKYWWDDLACAGAKIAVINGAVVLMTGMLWGRSAWGIWWTWSPRLTFSLVLWLLYVVYLMIRPSIESANRRALVSAVYGLIAFLDVPLVWLSARLIKDYVHPPKVDLAPSMQMTLMVWFVPIILLTIGLVSARYRLNRRHRARREALLAGGAP